MFIVQWEYKYQYYLKMKHDFLFLLKVNMQKFINMKAINVKVDNYA